MLILNLHDEIDTNKTKFVALWPLIGFQINFVEAEEPESMLNQITTI